MYRLYMPLALALATIFGLLVYVKNIYKEGIKVGSNEVKLEQKIIINKNVQDAIDEMLKFDYENYERIQTNENIRISNSNNSCIISAKWLQELNYLK